MSVPPTRDKQNKTTTRARRLYSSAPFGWQGFSYDGLKVAPGTVLGKEIENATLAMICSPSATAERIISNRVQPATYKHQGHLTVFPAGSAEPMRVITPAEIAVCRFDSAFLQRVIDEAPTKPRRSIAFHMIFQDHSLRHLMKLLLLEVRSNNPTGRLYAESVAEALAIRFVYSAGESLTSRRKSVSALPKHQVNRLRDFIDARLGEDLSLHALASEAGYSRAHFLRMFRQAVGVTPHQYVMQSRMQKAQSLLSGNEFSVADIAKTLGFSSSAHFSNFFRKNRGQRPAEYRRQHRNQVTPE
jgi:AraC family transcriptional regulator